MRWIRMAALVLALGAAREGLAGKPGGGTPPATGKIYFSDLTTFQAYPSYSLVYGSMDGSGGGRSTLLRTSDVARPSRLLHGGKRWFLGSVRLPLTGVSRNDLIAVREDGAGEVRLTNNDGTMYYWALDWAPDEDQNGATISMLARRWTGSTTADTVVGGTAGLYTAHISFDGAGDVIGLDSAPAFRHGLGIVSTGAGEQVDASRYSWSPDMTRLVVQSLDGVWDDSPATADPRIRVVDATTGGVTPLGTGDSPDWSPDGTKIAYRRWIASSSPGFALQTVRPDAGGLATLLFLKHRLSAQSSQYADAPRWSPDGAYVAYQHVVRESGQYTHRIYRISASGSGNTNLTPEVAAGSQGLGLVGWR